MTRTTTPGRRERRRAEVRQALLDAGLRLFGQQGIYATRVEDLTEAVDLGKGAFYNYFESKHALVADLLSQAVDALGGAIEPALGPGLAPSARVVVIARAHDRFFARHPAYVPIFHQARGVLQLAHADDDRLSTVFRDYLQRLAGWLSGPDGRRTARRLELAAVVAGAMMGSTTFLRAAQLPGDRGVLLDLLSHGMAGAMPAGSARESRTMRRRAR